MAISFHASPFETLGVSLRQSVESRLVRRRYKRGQHLFEAGQPHQGLFWIREGVVVAYVTGQQEGSHIAYPVYRGMWTAPSLISGVHAVSNRAATPCTVDVLEPEHGKALMREPDFARLIAAFCAEDVQLIADAAALATCEGAEEKVLTAVRHLLRSLGTDPRADVATMTGEVYWPFTVTVLARSLQLSRPYLSQVLTKLEREGRLVIRNRRLRLNG